MGRPAITGFIVGGSETSAKLNLTPGKYAKENIQGLFLVDF
jgi:hypothetical protein